jgi:signal transduction histidine kinase
MIFSAELFYLRLPLRKGFFLSVALFFMMSAQAFAQPSDTVAAVSDSSSAVDNPFAKVIICKGDRQFVPFEFINEKGEPDGFTVDVFKTLMSNLGLRYELTLDDWGIVRDQLDRKEIDVAIGMIYSPERSRNAFFGMPYCTICFNIVARKGSSIKTLEDLKGKKVIVQNRDRAHDYLLETHLTDDIVPVPTISEALEMLSAGQCDAVLSFDLTTYYYQKKLRFKNLEFINTDINPMVYAVVTNTDDALLLSTLNAGLAKMRFDGSLDKIYDKWFTNYNRETFYRKFSPYLWSIASLLLIVIFFVFLLQFRVNKATKSLREKNAEEKNLVKQLQEENERRKALETDLIMAKEQAEKAEKMEMVFLATMSHELRTPINAIVGFSELLQSPDATPEERQEYMDVINSNNEMVLRLISDILDLSKIESGTVELQIKPFDAVRVFDEECALFAPRCREKGLVFIADNPLKEYVITFDKSRFTQIISNFMTNALKYTFSGSITLGMREEDGGLRIFVRDTGKGIVKDDCGRVFEKFEKMDPTIKGTGLGLAICKAITDTFHGKIGVESELGKGSTFWAWLPSTPSQG